ncbi:MAG: ParA family protein, partial [Caldisericum sp.]|uniref:ParA family protein n=1 Tax=Caldisericum sp. TaxID=2499687 RepID=UPI003D0D155C
MNKIYVIANQKGGVGKTTLAINFAFYLSQQKNILFIDLDPQGSATFFLGDNPKNFVYSSRDIFLGKDLKSLIIKNRYNFDMIPAKLELEDVMSTKNINA